MCLFRFIILLSLSGFVHESASAQEAPESEASPPSINTILSEWRLIRSGGDSLGFAVYVPHEPGSTDTVEVYFNVFGEPSAWRAQIGSVHYAHVPTVGLFVVDDSLSTAFGVYATRRHLLEALELLSVIERRVKQASGPDGQP